MVGHDDVDWDVLQDSIKHRLDSARLRRKNAEEDDNPWCHAQITLRVQLDCFLRHLTILLLL